MFPGAWEESREGKKKRASREKARFNNVMIRNLFLLILPTTLPLFLSELRRAGF